jgi:hypothetical protein
MRQTIDVLAANNPFGLIADECRYVYIHGEGTLSPITEFHLRPGPIQVFLPLPKTPSPGSKINLYGVAVVVTTIGPIGDGTHAVTDFGCQTNALTQNQVPMLIRPCRAGGAKSPNGAGIKS